MKYRVSLSYNIEVEAESQAEALRQAQYSSIYDDKTVRSMSQRVTEVIQEAPPSTPEERIPVTKEEADSVI